MKLMLRFVKLIWFFATPGLVDSAGTHTAPRSKAAREEKEAKLMEEAGSPTMVEYVEDDRWSMRL